MAPIEGLSEIRWLPRLAKIRLGIKVEEGRKNPYPRATDYFVVPDELKQYVGDKPKALNIMFPSDNPEDFAPQYLKCYTLSQGLVCKGDGRTCRRKVDVATGAIADHTTEKWEYQEMACDPDTCLELIGDEDHHIRPQCRQVMNLMFLLPDCPGLGVYQLDTSSFYSIVHINSGLDLIRRGVGRLAGVPLSLTLEPQEVTPPGIKKKTIHTLYLRSNLKLADLRRLALPAPQASIAKPEEEEAPDDLYPTEVLAEPSPPPPAAPPAPAAQKPEVVPPKVNIKPRPEWDKVTQEMVPGFPQLYTVMWDLARLQPDQVTQEFGVTHWSKMTISAWEAFQKLKNDRFLPKPEQQKLV